MEKLSIDIRLLQRLLNEYLDLVVEQKTEEVSLQTKYTWILNDIDKFNPLDVPVVKQLWTTEDVYTKVTKHHFSPVVNGINVTDITPILELLGVLCYELKNSNLLNK